MSLLRSALEAEHDAESGIVQRRGIFEGEPLYVPYLWDKFLSGRAARDTGRVVVVPVDSDDLAVFPELAGRRHVRLLEQRGRVTEEPSDASMRSRFGVASARAWAKAQTPKHAASKKELGSEALYTIDDEQPFTFESFVRSNDDLDAYTLRKVQHLAVGKRLTLYRGALGTFTITRVL